MIKGYERGVEAAKASSKHTHFPNLYPEGTFEHKRFAAGRDGKPDPNDKK